jgi:hypothetical protein
MHRPSSFLRPFAAAAFMLSLFAPMAAHAVEGDTTISGGAEFDAIRCGGTCYANEQACFDANCPGTTAGTATCGACEACANDPSCAVSGGPSGGSSETSGAAQPAKLENPLGTVHIPTLVGRAVNIILGVAGSFALLMFVYGGFLWLSSGGSPEKIAKGKKVFTMAVVGLAIMFGAYALLDALFGAIGA